MTRSVSKVLGMLLCLVAMQQVHAFSLLGPYEDWQEEEIGYHRIYFQGLGIVEMGGPKNITEEYRLNTPVITYAYDSSFLLYFGKKGEAAIDQAFALMNRVPPVSTLSRELLEYDTERNQKVNYTAEAMNLLDLKSTMLGMLVEHMGLMGETHTFDIRLRVDLPPACEYSYTVVMRNFDPVTYDPSPYVNGVLYTYEIQQVCPTPNRCDAVEIPVNSAALGWSAVASQAGTKPGAYYLNLTRDDVGGMRYLYRKSNYNNEYLPDGAIIRPSAYNSPWVPPPVTTTNSAGTNTLALRCGVEKITFLKTRYDSTVGTYYKPLTNDYSITVLTNWHTVEQKVRRIIRRPDILIGAYDSTGAGFLFRSINYVTNAPSEFPVAGPGVIEPQMRITINKTGPAKINSNPYFLTEQTSRLYFRWGSFDGRTNAPIAYPDGTSISDLEDEILSGGY